MGGGVKPPFVVDGQRRPRDPALPIDFLDGIGLDRRMAPQPEVFEHSSLAPFVEAGGWIDTVPMELAP
jgi:hypothetical protein